MTEPKTTESLQQLLASVADENTSKILSAILLLAERLEAIEAAQVELHREFARLRQLEADMAVAAEASATRPAAESRVKPHGIEAIAPPIFTSEISEYEIGVLFEDQVGFDLSLRFNDPKSWEWYRIWGFNDPGHVLHVLLEACARSECPADAGLFTYRRDINSATVYATERGPLERLLSRFLQLSDSDEGTLQLIEQMNLSLTE
jgi:hypothetical protein